MTRKRFWFFALVGIEIAILWGAVIYLAQSRPTPEVTALHMISPQPHKTMYRDVLVTFRLKVAGTDLETLRKNAQFAADQMASHAPYGTEVEGVEVELTGKGQQ